MTVVPSHTVGAPHPRRLDAARGAADLLLAAKERERAGCIPEAIESYEAAIERARTTGEHAVMAEALRRLGHVCTLVHDLASAKDELRHGQFDLIVTDLVMDSQTDGMEVLAAARQNQPNAETILVTAHGDVPTAKAAIKGGAYDFIEKPLDLDVFRTLCGHAIQAVMLQIGRAHV